MNFNLPRETLIRLSGILSEPRRSSSPAPAPAPAVLAFEATLLAEGVCTLTAMCDHLAQTEKRGSSAIEELVEDLIIVFDIRAQGIYPRPEYLGDEVEGEKGLAAVDAVGFLIQLEAIGLEVDPSRLVDSLIAQIVDRKLLTSIEFDILLYKHTQGKRRIRFSADPVQLDGLHAQRTHKDSIGNRFSVCSRGDLPYSLEISGPKYREPKPQEAVTCALCGMLYVTNHPGDARRHKATHDRVVRRLNPKPSARLQKRVVTGIAGELVGPDAPLWMHGEVYERAAAFRREFGYDFIQWPGGSTTRAPSDWRGHLITGPGGEIAGACAFMHTTARKAEGEWSLQWIWIAPKFRRLGLLEARWADFLQRYGDFDLEKPLSEAMVTFLWKHGSEAQRASLPVF
ncbi:MAG: C2H2-type zinc finger protein (plasmid) [Pseudomonas rhizophila]|uniref:C2H2-type zinc finger protein n=1 Tax=Pseudomonas rhizophila TaxID=2045200 RepID=UPI003F6C746C